MKKLGWQTLVGIVILLIATAPAFGKQQQTVNLISAPFGTGSYVLGSALEDISVKHHPWLRISHSESPGLVFNIKKLDKDANSRKNTIVASTIGVIWLAESGLQPFDRAYKSPKLIANYNLISVWLATLQADLQNPADFAGKKIAMGRAPQITWAIQPEMIIRHGWRMADKVKIEYVGTGPSVPALIDGLADAIVIGGYLNPKTFEFSLSPQTTELIASGRTIHHISWGSEAIRKTKATGMPITEITLPPKTVKGQENPLASFTDSVAWCADVDFPEDLAYEITKLIIQRVADFAGYHNLGKLMSPESLPFGWEPAQIHPGALKAYREAGILD